MIFGIYALPESGLIGNTHKIILTEGQNKCFLRHYNTEKPPQGRTFPRTGLTDLAGRCFRTTEEPSHQCCLEELTFSFHGLTVFD